MANYRIWLQRYPYFELTSAADKSLEGCANSIRIQNTDEAMFVGIVQFVKKKKGTTPTAIPSVVWLKFLDACTEIAVNAIERAG